MHEDVSDATVTGERFSQLRTTSVISTGVNISTPTGQILLKSFEKIWGRFSRRFNHEGTKDTRGEARSLGRGARKGSDGFPLRGEPILPG